MRDKIEEILQQVSSIILGKRQQIKLALTCLFAEGHLLIEDLPGVGKTTLAHTLAHCLGLGFRRVQFTSDLLPADILGVSVFEQKTGAFVFHPGPIFTNVLLADEINRATPKTQSALLEAMEEKQVTVEGETKPLPLPFFVMATQNPLEQAGTFPLPESQLDRFLMRITLGYPARDAERRLFEEGEARKRLPALAPLLEPGDIVAIQGQVAKVHVSEALLDYLQDVVDFTRHSGDFHVGLSPRAGLNLLTAARAWAFLEGRDFVMPEDIQEILPWVVGHRLRSADRYQEIPFEELKGLLENVPVP